MSAERLTREALAVIRNAHDCRAYGARCEGCDLLAELDAVEGERRSLRDEGQELRWALRGAMDLFGRHGRHAAAAGPNDCQLCGEQLEFWDAHKHLLAVDPPPALPAAPPSAGLEALRRAFILAAVNDVRARLASPPSASEGRPE